MYFDTATQTHVLENFHFALRDGGYLFLGKSEALAARSELFVPVDLKRRVFAKASRVSPPRPPAQPPTPQVEALERLARDAVVRDAGFESVPLAQLVVDRDGNLALANFQARALFDLSHRDLGAPFQDLEVSYRPVELRSRIEQVYSERHVIALRDVEWRIGGNVRYIDVQIAPLTASSGEVVGAGVTFTEVTRYRRLQDVLQDTKRDAETAYEELQSTNEELETTNEELQSTNEELETMNEELQSTNEELETMNEELNERSTELNQANSFLGAVLASLQAGVIVVNGDLLVQAWNTGARELWGLHEDEVAGKHLLNLDIGFPLDDLRQPIRAAIADGSETRTITFQAVNRRGHEIEVQVTVTPLAGRDGAALGAIVMMQAVQGAV
jgi:two-component system CheB/CheR fusion protein